MTSDAPREESAEEAEEYRRSLRKENRKKGLLIVNTGTGKGKTTAAFGLAMRARGRGMRVAMIQFIKPGTARFGEIRAARDLGIEVQGMGDGWTWRSKDLDESAALARAGWARAQEVIMTGEHGLVILDEFTYPLHYGWLDTAEVLAWIAEHKPPMLHLAITGRYAPEALIEAADLVTEMRLVKHPFKEQGIRAQPGIEF
ncbi:MAG: cob(I)yrinic acid a,c-diamide adenosyltransferase [Dehalococcoidia bacterium]|nr:MAG: cob(I)yrinic acid a,c-diamide adenosyltransferase [Dehalococcoidia bacterium]